jgi:hypothetical protein
MSDPDDLKLAKRVQSHYVENPTHEIQHVATELGETPGRITFILDQFLVEDDTVKFIGPGGGGGWVPLEG